jgi:hypothetical protein
VIAQEAEIGTGDISIAEMAMTKKPTFGGCATGPPASLLHPLTLAGHPTR